MIHTAFVYPSFENDFFYAKIKNLSLDFYFLGDSRTRFTSASWAETGASIEKRSSYQQSGALPSHPSGGEKGLFPIRNTVLWRPKTNIKNSGQLSGRLLYCLF